MEQAIITTSLPSQQQKQEWKDDPLQMLAKQCDTISGDEDKINKQQMGNKRKYLNGHSNNNNDFGNKNGQNKTKAKSPNKVRKNIFYYGIVHGNGLFTLMRTWLLITILHDKENLKNN
uniref:Uncharacterized protein n=1 Tax=Meloidogyne hapla TaxID=6305 RepID=A0A1I8B4A8_MELHA